MRAQGPAFYLSCSFLIHTFPSCFSGNTYTNKLQQYWYSWQRKLKKANKDYSVGVMGWAEISSMEITWVFIFSCLSPLFWLLAERAQVLHFLMKDSLHVVPCSPDFTFFSYLEFCFPYLCSMSVPTSVQWWPLPGHSLLMLVRLTKSWLKILSSVSLADKIVTRNLARSVTLN